MRLLRGDYGQQTVYSHDPVSVARSFEAEGADVIHVVDLDAAKTGELKNLEHVTAIARSVGIPVEVGGGIRNLEAAEKVLEAGAARVVCGTALVKDPELAARMLDSLGERVVAGIDARNGRMATEGWTEQSDRTAVDLAKWVESLGGRRIILTDIDRDGVLSGPNLELLAEVAAAVDIPVIQSGGVGTLDHVREIQAQALAEGVIIGKAIYEGRFSVSEAVALR